MRQRGGSGAGLGLALFSAACFGTSGSFATPLMQAGWSSGAAVAIRVTVAGLLLVVPAALALRGRWSALRRNGWLVLAYGLVAVGGCQLFYFNALQTLSVGVALLLEYLGMLMVVGWLWIRHRQRPRRLTVAGAGLAVAGLVLVLDVIGGGARLDVVGVLWGLAAAVGLAAYFLLSSRLDSGLPPLALACGGLLVGALALVVLGAVGALPMHVSTADVSLVGREFPWWIPVLGLAVIAAAVAYAAGIAAVRVLGAKLGSFVALTEVLFAVLFAWLLLGQLPAPIQLAGGVLIVAGVALVRLDEARHAVRADGDAGVPVGDGITVMPVADGTTAIPAGHGQPAMQPDADVDGDRVLTPDRRSEPTWHSATGAPGTGTGGSAAMTADCGSGATTSRGAPSRSRTPPSDR
jgi:drug/metabolite transporter (DMT)-like permease